MTLWHKTAEYKLITDHYRGEYADRSGRHKMEHIKEGCRLLVGWQRPDVEHQAFCLHPLVETEGFTYERKHSYILAAEMMKFATAYLCRPETDDITYRGSRTYLFKYLGPMSEACAWLLLADKVQNRSDFMKYHAFTHARADMLIRYFDLWIQTLHTYYLPKEQFNGKARRT